MSQQEQKPPLLLHGNGHYQKETEVKPEKTFLIKRSLHKKMTHR